MSQTEGLLFAENEPYRRGNLRVNAVHTLYFEECGNPSGKPVVLLHGGPGGGVNPVMRRLHDPSAYRMILFDQRGCGHSTPYGDLSDNTTWSLVGDIEALRQHLGIARWQVFGGSWGSTLALAYAQTHPDRVSELVLRGIFLLRRAELLWFYQDGASWIFPEAWQGFLKPIPVVERGDLMSAYYRRLTAPDRETQLVAARAWSQWEGSALSLLEDPERVARFGSDAYALAFARIESHFFVNGGFLRQDDQLLADAHRLKAIPGRIVHGRYDMCTPMKNAFDLKTAWPQAELMVVPDGGHALSEPGITRGLIAATEAFKSRLA